jgi:uncharacterized protein YqeY
VQDQLERDLKAAMLAGEKDKTEILKGIKSALQYEAVSQKSGDRSLSEEQILKVLARESKKRQETAELYKNAGEQERAKKELDEKEIIDGYLPKQLSEDEISKSVIEEIENTGASSMADMGRVIGAVKGKLGASADGSVIARLVKEKIPQ